MPQGISLSPAEGGIISDYFSSFPWSPRDAWREPGGGEESDALAWSSAVELGRAPVKEEAYGKWAAPQRDSSAQKQLLCKVQQGCCLVLKTAGGDK